MLLRGLRRMRSTHPALLKNGDGYSIEFSLARNPENYPGQRDDFGTLSCRLDGCVVTQAEQNKWGKLSQSNHDGLSQSRWIFSSLMGSCKVNGLFIKPTFAQPLLDQQSDLVTVFVHHDHV